METLTLKIAGVEQRVEVRTRLLGWQKAGLSYTATGYGARIPTRREIRYNGRWRRVYCYIYSNVGTCYIGRSLKEGKVVDD